MSGGSECRRPTNFGAETYAQRNVAERGVKRFEQGRAVAARYEKRAANHRAMVVIADLVIRPTSYESPEAGPTRTASGTETSPYGGCAAPWWGCRVSPGAPLRRLRIRDESA
jgi:hypothetical protein